MSEVWLGGVVVSEDPLVTYSTRTSGAPVGIPGNFPEYFANRPALHLIHFTWTMEGCDLRWIARDLRVVESQLPQSHFVFLCNTEMESFAFSRLALPNFTSSPAISIDETAFRVLSQPPEPRYDAIYNGRLTPWKRHALASRIGRLALVYGPSIPGAPVLYDETRAVLPHAFYANHDAGAGSYRFLSSLECAGLMNVSHVGLALSAEEGIMRAAIEYLLCGLPVVSTRALGGRERYLRQPYATIVPDNPDAVAAAVKRYVDAPVPRSEVRNYILSILDFERHCFLLTLNAIVKDLFDVADRFSEFPKVLRGSDRFRSSNAIKADLERLPK